jgi:outer membrane protein assembly factor BamB
MDYSLREGEASPNPGKRNVIEGSERVVCFDAQSGEWLWEQAYECPYRISFPAGPRCTPTVDDDRVYSLGAEGRVMCMNAVDGSILWSIELKERYGLRESPIWGFASHPLVWGDKLFVMVGGEEGALLALDKMTGQKIWRACPDEDTGYCPPKVIMAGGVAQLIAWTPTTINSVNPDDGSVYWSFPLKPDYKMPVAAPAVENGLLFASGEGASICLRLGEDKPTAEEVWNGRGFTTSHSPVTLLDGHAIGVDLGGALRCITLEDGERKWETFEPTTGGRPSGPGAGFIVRCGDKYLIAGENGVLTIAKMSPEKYETISSAKIIEPNHINSAKKVLWSHPAFANGCCYWKNDNELVCVSIATAPSNANEDPASDK